MIGGRAQCVGVAAIPLPFIGGHAIGPFADLVRKALPGTGEAEVPARVAPATALLLAFRGGPFIRSADEQGFGGHGDALGAREDMFARRMGRYNDHHLLGIPSIPSTAHSARTRPCSYRPHRSSASGRSAPR